MILHKSSRYACSTCILAAAVLIISVPQRAVAALEIQDRVLDLYSTSLTTYLYDGNDGAGGDPGTTIAQEVRPLAEQRGVNLDGSLRLGSTHPMSLQGNPFGEAWNANMMLSGVRLDTGTYVINDVDIALPSPGPSWVIGRSYNARQEDDQGTRYDSNGYQGYNWFQSAHPEIVLFEGATDDLDVIYLVYGADRYIEFKRFDDTSTEFKSKNGAAGVIEFIEDTGTSDPNLYVYTDQRGWQVWFFGFDTDANFAKGQLWKIVAPKPGAGDYVAFAGHETNVVTALESYDYPGNRPTSAGDSAGRAYSYSYYTTTDRLKMVDVKVSSTLVARVEYAYYGASDNHGLAGDLKLVTVSTPLTEDTSGYDPAKWLIRKKYYRYYQGPYHPQNNPGHDHQIKMILDFEGYRTFDWVDSILNDSPQGQSVADDDLKPYASAYFEYENPSYKIANVFFNGECGCSGSANGTHKFTYEDNAGYTDNPGYDTTWKNRTIVERPTADETAFVTQYFDEVGQPLHRVNTKLTPSDTTGDQKTWATMVVRNSDATNKIYGQITDIHSPANVTDYTHSTASFTTSTTVGLVTVFTRAVGSPIVLRGFLQDAKHKTGTDAENVYLDLTLVYTSRTLNVGDVPLDRPLISSQRIYTQEITSGTTGSRLTSFGQTWHETTDTTDVLYITPKVLTTTFPAVSTLNNGPGGSGLTSKLYLNETGQTVWKKTTDAIITYWQYRDSDGRLEKSIRDADTNHDDFTGPGITIPFGFESDESGELHLVTCFGYAGGGGMGMGNGGGCNPHAGGDSIVTGDGPASVTYRARLKDGRMARLVFPHFVDKVSDEYYGPVNYTVFNLAGQVELQGVIALSDNFGEFTIKAPTDFVDETKADPLEAIDHGGTTIGTVQQMSTSIFNETGLVLQQSRAYFTVPSSGEGTEGTDYDATRYAYDAMGRTARIKDPTGTIQRTVYDTRGRTTEQWTGTNDYLWDEGETTGPADMVKTVALEYDSGSDEGNSYLTKQTLFLDDTGSSTRVATFTNDVRGRAVIQANPASPHVLNLFDNLGRTTAGGLYSSTSGLTVTSDPTSVSTNRLSLSQTSYDELGRVFRTKTHKIDMADGSDDDNLQTDNWFDQRGRLIKVDGSQLMKYQYNRLGQQTHQFVLAVDDDTAYAHAVDVAGDIVLQESQTVLNVKTGITLMSAVIDRDHDDFGAGEYTDALDDNGDTDDLKYTAADIHGQIQITAYWYDSINRSEAVALYGTNAGNDPFTRASTAPLRTDDAVEAGEILLTEYAFNADGTLLSITDPEDLETQYKYDDLGRQTAVISNYVDGSPSGLTADDDHVTRFVYDDGLRIKLWVDIYPVDFDDSTPDAEDQVTTYTYGVSVGDTTGPSKFDSHRLLRTIQYPDATPNTVTFAYNAQGQQIWSEDQENIEIESDYDDLGREEHRRVTDIDNTQFNDDVLRISTVYDSLGRVSTVTQYDDAVVGDPDTVVDQVEYTYDGWGNVTNFEQDNNSAVGASGSIDDYEVKYAYAKATAGRNTIRRTKLRHVYASTVKKKIDYTYSSSSRHDHDVSRVTKVQVVVDSTATTIATYDYLGVGQIVRTRFPEPDVFSKLYTSGSSYDHMDRFNRVTTNRWTKDLATDVDFYAVDISYDRDSSITAVVDNIHVDGSGNGRFDVSYTLDDLNRLRKAEEGDWDGSTLSNLTRQQLWEDPSANPALDQLGNWTHVRLDLDGNNDFIGANEYDDDRTHNIVNELTARDVDNDTAIDYALIYDDLGELTDDGEFYEYKYDAFGRLIEIANTSTQALVVEYTYNGLGRRTGWHYDVDVDGTVEDTSDDPWYYFAYDERWRIVATYRAADTSPKEQFVYHNAGLGGYGGSSAIDGVILRDKDADTNWEDASDGTLEERIYYCQNWRGDVSVL
ncbi:MAG: RHS repeat protein, partial [Planctomycetes bacterium]|nr:RHS repeat protein [Planctomycetota bacterium]